MILMTPLWNMQPRPIKRPALPGVCDGVSDTSAPDGDSDSYSSGLMIRLSISIGVVSKRRHHCTLRTGEEVAVMDTRSCR